MSHTYVLPQVLYMYFILDKPAICYSSVENTVLVTSKTDQKDSCNHCRNPINSQKLRIAYAHHVWISKHDTLKLTVSEMTTKPVQIPWKKAELTVKRFEKVIEVDLTRLKQLKKNILEHEKNGDRKSAKNEISKARQTINNIQLSLTSLGNIKDQVDSEDQNTFDKKLAAVHSSVKLHMEEFQGIDADIMHYLDSDLAGLLTSVTDKAEDSVEQKVPHIQKRMDPQHEELSTQLSVTEQDEERIYSIAQDVNDVKEMMTQLSTLVSEQQTTVDSIEDNVEKSHSNVKSSGLELNKATVLKTAGFTVLGAVCGALVGGPVGLIAGAKIGTLAAGTGMAVGAVAGHKIKKRNNERAEIELQNLHVASDMADSKLLRNETIADRTQNQGNRISSHPDLISFDD